MIAWTAIGAWLRGSAGWSIAGVVLLAAGVFLGARLAILLVTFSMSSLVGSPRGPGHRAGPISFASLAAREWLWMLANNLYWLPFEAHALRPDPQPVPGGPMPVVVVHGYISNRGTVCSLVRALDAGGAGPVFAPSLPAVFEPIEAFAEHLSGAIEGICQATGHARVVVVGHSMGGLIARAYLARHGSGRVARLVTLGSPHHGTRVAPLGLGANAAQMRIGSDFLAGLEKSEGKSGPGIPALSVWTAHDNLVAPQDSSRLHWAREAKIHGVAHLAMLGDPRVHRLVLAEIAAARGG